MWADEDTSKKLTVRCFSQKSDRWRHTHNGTKSLLRRNANSSAVQHSPSSSSGGSQPPSPTNSSFPTSNGGRSGRRVPIDTIKILTWNVDFMAPNCRTRLTTVLDHIQKDVFNCSSGQQPHPCCILLQEVDAEAMPKLLEHEWLRQYFSIVPTTCEDWSMPNYGNVTLVSRTVPVLSAQILTFGNSMMGRHSIIVDLLLDGRSTSSSEDEEESGPSTVTVRVANVHLESLPMGTSARPLQLSAVAKTLQEDGIYVGVVAGDMNDITPQDRLIHAQAGLLDAWKRDDDDDEGLTWGFQPPCQYPVGRLDKIFYNTDEGCSIDEPQRVGVGLKTSKGQWASDHYGLITTLRLT